MPVTLTLHPADAGSGIVFIRHAPTAAANARSAPDIDAVTATEFATVLGDATGPLVSTVEHVLAALSRPRRRQRDGRDRRPGSADHGRQRRAVRRGNRPGRPRTLVAPRRYIKVLKPIRVAEGDAFGELAPIARGFRIEVEIDFDHPLIGRQQIVAVDVEPDMFRRELARARTFGFMRDVAKLWNAGYALGASLENTLVVTDDRLLNPEGLRFPDEFVRHKALDAIGDLALAGVPLLGAYRSVRGGHRLNHAVLSRADGRSDRLDRGRSVERRRAACAAMPTGRAAAPPPTGRTFS